MRSADSRVCAFLFSPNPCGQGCPRSGKTLAKGRNSDRLWCGKSNSQLRIFHSGQDSTGFVSAAARLFQSAGLSPNHPKSRGEFLREHYPVSSSDSASICRRASPPPTPPALNTPGVAIFWAGSFARRPGNDKRTSRRLSSNGEAAAGFHPPGPQRTKTNCSGRIPRVFAYPLSPLAGREYGERGSFLRWWYQDAPDCSCQHIYGLTYIIASPILHMRKQI